MFSSIFGRKKTTPEDDPIPGPDSTSSQADDFIFVEPKNRPTPNPPPSSNMYPPMPPIGGYLPQAHIPRNMVPVHYLDGVPFKLSDELCEGETLDATQMEVDGILALMTRQVQIDEDYEFTLERAIVAQ